MATYSGKQGKIAFKVGSAGAETHVVHMTNWTADLSKEIDETSYFGGSESEEGYVEKTPGVKSWTASADGAADFGSDSGQKALFDAWKADTVVTLTLYLAEQTAVTGTALIESLSVSHAADGKGELTINFSGNGTPDLLLPTGA